MKGFLQYIVGLVAGEILQENAKLKKDIIKLKNEKDKLERDARVNNGLQSSIVDQVGFLAEQLGESRENIPSSKEKEFRDKIDDLNDRLQEEIAYNLYLNDCLSGIEESEEIGVYDFNAMSEEDRIKYFDRAKKQ